MDRSLKIQSYNTNTSEFLMEKSNDYVLNYGSGTGDNLGNHLATQTLDMDGQTIDGGSNDYINVARIIGSGNNQILDLSGNDFIFDSDVYALQFLELSVTLDKKNKTALSQFTTTSEERTKNGSYDHKNKDDIDFLLVSKNKTRCDWIEVLNETTKKYIKIPVNCTIVQQESKSISKLVELLRDAIYEIKVILKTINNRLEVSEQFQDDVCKEQNLIYNKYDWCDKIK